jgi:hypothetical protein
MLTYIWQKKIYYHLLLRGIIKFCWHKEYHIVVPCIILRFNHLFLTDFLLTSFRSRNRHNSYLKICVFFPSENYFYQTTKQITRSEFDTIYMN